MRIPDEGEDANPLAGQSKMDPNTVIKDNNIA